METPSTQPRGRRRWWLLQAAVSIALLAWMFSRPEFRGDLGAVLVWADPLWLAGGVLLAGAVQLLSLLRWRIVLKMVGVRVGWADALAAFFAGLFFNLFLPGAAGGDLVRIGMLAARGCDIGRSALSVVMDRLAGAVSMILLGASLMAWRHDWLTRSPLVAGLTRTIFIYLAGLALLIVLSIVLSAKGVVSRLPPWWPARNHIVELSAAYFQCARQWRRSLLAVVVSTIMLGLFFLTYYLAARAYAVELELLDFLALMPTVDIIAALPVSLGGLGVREGIFVLLLGGLAHTPAPLAVAVSLCGFTMTAVWGLPGAVLWLLRGEARP